MFLCLSFKIMPVLHASFSIHYTYTTCIFIFIAQPNIANLKCDNTFVIPHSISDLCECISLLLNSKH